VAPEAAEEVIAATTTSVIDAGTVLAVTEAMLCPAGRIWTGEQVAHAVALAYDTGRRHGWAEDMAEDAACWEEFAQPQPTREQRVAIRIAELPGRTPPAPQRYDDPDWPPVAVPGGGIRLGAGQAIAQEGKPPTCLPADPNRARPRFPNLDDQAAWLSPADVEFCRRYAREQYR
jgi:hypothetical protein